MNDRPRLRLTDALPAEAASRLLTRASEMDAFSDDEWTVSELREAATAAGISSRAFAAAVAEMRQAGQLRTLEACAPRRRSVRVAGAVVGVAMLVAGGVFVVSRAPVLHEAGQSPPLVAIRGPDEGAAAAPVVVRTADGGAIVTMSVERDGPLFAALGVEPGADGRRVGHIRVMGSGGTATTPAALNVSGGPGVVEFRAPAGGGELELIVRGTATQVRGHTVRLVRDRIGGPLRAEVGSRSAR